MVIAVTNLKGGCGKTTLATNIAVALANRNKKVVLIDTDLGQGSTLEWSGNRPEDQVYIPVIGKAINQITRDVSQLSKEYDMVIIDGVPQLEEMADRTMMAADVVIVPLKSSLIDFRSMESFLKRYRQVKALKESNGLRSDAFIVLNEVNPNTNAYKDVKEGIDQLEEELLHSIHVRTAYRDAYMYGLGAVEYDDPKAAKEINDLVDRIEEKI